MARRRYISTEISVDREVNQLARTSDFAALLYTWMIPHAEEDGTLSADSEELLMQICPGRRDKEAEDVEEAVSLMVDEGLIIRHEDRLYFPHEAFYRYQNMVAHDKRRDWDPTPQTDTEPQASPPDPNEPQSSPENSASFSPSPSPSPSPSVPVQVLRKLPEYKEKPDDEKWLAEKAAEYPRIDLAVEIRKCRDHWEPIDEEKKPKRKNWRSRLNNWFSRARPSPAREPPTSQPSVQDLPEIELPEWMEE